MGRIFALVLVIGVLGAGWALRDRLPWGGARTETAAAPARVKPAKSVAALPVAAATVIDRVESVGTVKARDAVVVTVEAPGIVREILFENGATVERGAVLLRLDAAQEKAQVAAARTAVETAQRTHERAVQLRKAGTAPQQVLDDAAAALEAARAALAETEARLAERTVRAPFAGRVGFREVSPGAYVQPGEAITTLDDVSSVHVDFMIPERELAAVAVGQPVALRSVAHPDRVFQGRVASIGTRIDPATRQVQVRAEVPNRNLVLRPGQLATVEVAVRERPAVVVPDTAVVTVGHQTFAFVVDAQGQVKRRELRIAGRRDGGLEVAAGLEPGERLVVEGAMKLDDGDKVRLVPPVALAGTEPGT